MSSTDYPTRYQDPTLQEKHRHLHSANSLLTPLELILPPGLSQHDFNAAIGRFVKVLGKNGVLTGKALEDYIDPFELWEVEGKRSVPSAAVLPTSVEEVQEVVGVARTFKIPLWTFSRGKNLGHGGPAPRVSGSIALDLHRMNKIIEVNDKFSYAVVEPGVTFLDLYDHCVEKKIRAWPSTPTLGWGSVVGNTLERGFGFTPTGFHHQNMAGLEVVLGNGEVVRTGQFAISNTPNSHLSQYSYGPSIEGLFLQSNLGIVTKMGIWLTPQPQSYISCVVDMPELEDIETMVEAIGPLRRNGVLTNTVYFSNILENSSALKSREQLYNGKEPIPEWRIKELQKEFDLGYWSARTGLYGPKEVIQAQVNEVKRVIAEKAPSSRVRYSLFSAENANELLDAGKVPDPHGGIWVGVPSMAIYNMVNYRVPAKKPAGVGAHRDYLCVLPSSGKEILEWVKVARDIHDREGFELFCDFHMHERHVVACSLIAFDKTNPEQRRAVNQIWYNQHREATERGYGVARTHVNNMDVASEGFDWNNHAYRRFVESLKDTVDPDGILSPGKMGIWPQRSRVDKARF